MTPAAPPEPPPPDPAPVRPLSPAEPPEWAFIRAEVENMRRGNVRLFLLALDKDGKPSVRPVGPERRAGALVAEKG